MSDVTRIAGQAQTFPYTLRDAQNNLVVPLSAPQQSIHASAVDAGTGANPLSGPTALGGSLGSYTGTYPVGLASGTYYLRTVTQLTASTQLVDVDDRLVLVTVSGNVVSSIVSLAEVKQQLGQAGVVSAPLDAELQGYIDAVGPVVEFIAGDILPVTRVDSFDGGKLRISLPHHPVLSITSVTESDFALGTDQYSLYAQSGVLARVTSNWYELPFLNGTRNITVTYTTGKASVPPQVRLAALIILQHWWDRLKQGGRPAFNGQADYSSGGVNVMGYAVPSGAVTMLQAGSARIPGIA